MSEVAFITDSTTNIPKELLGKTKLHVVPSVVIWGNEELRDGVDIQPGEFYKRLSTAAEMPTTSQPTPNDFKAKYEELIANGQKDIVVMTVSAKLSGTLSSAEQAREMSKGGNIEVIDGYSASLGTGWPLLQGIKAAENGKSFKEVVNAIKNARDKSGVLLMVDTLEFLHRGGRIGGASRFLGTALSLKPILELQDGRLEALERVRTKSKAIARLIDLIEERTAGQKPLRVASLHANAEADAQAILDEVKKRMNPIQAVLTEVSPAVGTHTGPGTLGLCYLAGID
ncbi:MAG: DegV family protein [Chloroflexi bacterium]|nr:DegV family protein [Chloroflexota bacterium]MQC26057.1 DegV family protein [Chloroflexota bacterium]